MFLRSRLASIKFSILLLTLSSFASAQSQIPAQIDPDSACKPYLRAVAYFDHPSSVENRFGTGFLFSRDGLVVTAAHVVIDKNTNKYRQDITAILPSFYRGRHVDALWLPATPLVSVQEALKHDVAVLKVDGHNADGSELAHLELDEDGAVRAGDEVLIVGFPGGRMKCEIRQVLRVQGYRIFYKGINIGGLSGSPMISLDRRKVVGIVGGYSSLFKGGEIPTGESYGIDVAAVRKLLQKAEPPLKTESARATLAMRKLFHAR